MINSNEFDIKDGILVKYNGNSKDVIIPEGVIHIGEKAFCMCESLKQIAIPNSVIEIGDCAFVKTSLTSVTIPKGTNIQENTFDKHEKI